MTPHDDDNKALARLEPASGLPAITTATIDSSRVNRIMGRLIAKAHSKNIQKIAVFSWDSDDHTLAVSSILAGAFSHQLDTPCALVLSEGVRISKGSSGLHDTINLPDVDVPGLSEKVSSLLLDLNRTYPVQIYVAPSVIDWETTAETKMQLALRCHGALLAIPQSGIPRRALSKILKLVNKHKVSLLGIVPYGKKEL